MKPLSQEWLAELNLSPQWRERTPVAQAPSPAAEQAGHSVAATPDTYAYATMVDVAQMDWPQLKQSVAVCTLCPLHEKRTQAVFGVGDEQADCLFVGEAPGAEEDAQANPSLARQASSWTICSPALT
jgi:hypothetical protein